MRKAKSSRLKDGCDSLSLLDSGRLQSVTSLSCCLADLLVVAASSVFCALKMAVRVNFRIMQVSRTAVTSTDFSPENLSGKELHNPRLVRRALFSGHWKKVSV